jgi:KH domain
MCVQAEVQGKTMDGGIQLHTRSAKFGKVRSSMPQGCQPVSLLCPRCCCCCCSYCTEQELPLHLCVQHARVFLVHSGTLPLLLLLLLLLLCARQLSGGQLVTVHAKLVRKQRQHFTTLTGLDVDIIAGLNGLVWVSPHVPQSEDGVPQQQQQQQQQRQQPPPLAGVSEPSRTQREAVARVAGAVRALAALMLQIYPDAIREAYVVRVWLVLPAVPLQCPLAMTVWLALSPPVSSLHCRSQASVEAGVEIKDMTERGFLEILAQREVTRRRKESSAAAAGDH